MLENLQLICFEVTTLCNMSEAHKEFCPAAIEYRHKKKKPASNSDFLSFLDKCIEEGFGGAVGFHYYNEPTLDLNRCLELNTEIQKRGLKTILWTNGTCKKDLSPFTYVFITQYEENNEGDKCIAYNPDDRLSIYKTDEIAQEDYTPCYRPSHIEMPIDFFGQIHLCCADWEGKRRIGCIYRDSFNNILENWRRVIYDATNGCKLCRQCRGLVSSPACLDSSYKI